VKQQRILFLVTNLGVGGLETYLLRFLRHLRDTGVPWQIRVVCKSGHTGALYDHYLEVGADVVTCRQRHFNPFDHRRLLRVMKDGPFDAVCDFTGDFAGIPLSLARTAGIPRRIVFYRQATHHFRTDIFRLAYANYVRNLVKRKSTAILSNSMAALDFFYPSRGPSESSFAVIPNGVPQDLFDEPFDRMQLRRELRIPDNARVIGHTGRFVESKNHRAIIEVAERICRQRDDVCFLLCGPGVRENLEPELRQRNLLNRVIMPGTRSDIPRVLQLLDAYYFPSTSEGQPNALLEAMFAGVPFVASDIASIKECVPVEMYAWLVDCNDTASASQLLLEHLSTLNSGSTHKRRAQLVEHVNTRFSASRCFGQFMEALQA